MNLFDDYAKYYNLFYRDKNYSEEASYIDRLIKKYKPSSNTILNLGCGTGRHDTFLAKKGYKICGVDISNKMIDIAKQDEIDGKLEFLKGDVRSINLNKKFDIVISLFHVMSYQKTNLDIKNFILTAKKHLTPKGLFIFDFWYGPGVLSDPPVVRIKKMDSNDDNIIRIAEPMLNNIENTVDVNYHIISIDKKTSKCEQFFEKHTMRYFFIPEIKEYLSMANLSLNKSTEWPFMDKELTENSWYGLIIAS